MINPTQVPSKPELNWSNGSQMPEEWTHDFAPASNGALEEMVTDSGIAVTGLSLQSDLAGLSSIAPVIRPVSPRAISPGAARRTNQQPNQGLATRSQINTISQAPRKKNPELSIIIPVLNEEDNIQPLYEKLLDSLALIGRSFEVIFVDDGSTDKSYWKLKNIAMSDARIKVVRFVRNFGQTAGLSAGIDHATGNVIIPMDADLQNDPKDIVRLLQKMDEGYDVVSGWRKDRKDELFTRLIPSWMANKLISIISGVPLHDYGCSLKAYRRDVIKHVRLYGEMHRFVPIYATWNGARVAEIPVTHFARRHGQSKYGLSRTFKVVLDLITVKFMSEYFTKPIYVFGAAGFASLGAAFLAFVVMIVLKCIGYATFIETPLPVLVCMFIMIGFQFILMGLIAEILMRTYHESQGKRIYAVDETINVEDKPERSTQVSAH